MAHTQKRVNLVGPHCPNSIHSWSSGLILHLLLGENLSAIGIFCLMRVSLHAWGLGPYSVVYGNNVIDCEYLLFVWGPGLCCIKFDLWGKGGWRLNSQSQSCGCFMPTGPSVQTLDTKYWMSRADWQILHMCYHKWLLGELNSVCLPLLGEETASQAWPWPCDLISFCWF